MRRKENAQWSCFSHSSFLQAVNTQSVSAFVREKESESIQSLRFPFSLPISPSLHLSILHILSFDCCNLASILSIISFFSPRFDFTVWCFHLCFPVAQHCEPSFFFSGRSEISLYDFLLFHRFPSLVWRTHASVLSIFK